jgi:hypothetical protein
VKRAISLLTAASALALTLAGNCARAQITSLKAPPGTPPDEPATIKLTVSPAPEPKPALKYHFLVPPVDQIHGNAATFYYKSMTDEGASANWIQRIYYTNGDKVEQWLETPLDQLPKKEVKDMSYIFSDHLDSLRNAARCDACDWGDSIREHGIMTLLPQLQSARGMGRALALRARSQIAEGNAEDAIETLQLGYSLSRNLGHAPTLVQNLVGMSIQTTLDDQTRTLITTERAPNLYWALSELAASPVDIRQAMSYETRSWEFTIHELSDLVRQTLSEHEAYKLTLKVWSTANKMTGNRDDSLVQQAKIALWASQRMPAAREYLISHGYKEATLNAMPQLQTALLYEWKRYQEVQDDYFKWGSLPNDEALQGLQLTRDRADKLIKQGVGQPFSEGLPAIRAVLNAHLRTQRQTNLLRTIEALRMHASETSQWPESLGDVKSVPVPRDSYRNKPFEYSVKDGVAILATPHDETWTVSEGAIRYEISLRKIDRPSHAPPSK